jgi:Protein of unknown function (DUF3147)
MAAAGRAHWAQAVVSGEPIQLQPGKLSEIKWYELAIRFAFGALASLVAGVVAILFGARAGGVWLAFPAILPAGLTLLERKQGRDAAERDVRGAVLGAIGMVGFAVAVYLGVPRVGGLLAVLVAVLVWAAVTLALYLGLRALLNRRDSQAT